MPYLTSYLCCDIGMCRFRHKGVDEHAWRHTRKVDKYVIVIIDLTPIGDNTGPARLLDLVEGRSKKAFETWLEHQPTTSAPVCRSWRWTASPTMLGHRRPQLTVKDPS